MSKLTFREGVIISWKREIKIGNPRRILELAFFTLVYGAVHYLFVVPTKLIERLLSGNDNHG